MSEQRLTVLTVGHSTHPIERFLGLLAEHEVTVVADVRSVPFSRMNPQFNRESIERSLQASGIEYVFMGHELGGRSDDRSCYEKGRILYARLAGTAPFRLGIERVIEMAGEHRTVLMCAEKEPLECHRTLLVSRVLAEKEVDVAHILWDGRLERHAQSMDRLLDLTGVPRADLFRSRYELVERALALQEEKFAYVDRRGARDFTEAR
jgi:uncharacterized protein (DUF488 family)